MNSVIMSKSPEKRKTKADSLPRGMREPLTTQQTEENVVTAYKDLMDILRLFCLPGLGCVHCRREFYMANNNIGNLMHYSEVYSPCETQCFICDDSYKQYFLPVIHKGAVSSSRANV